ncbi:S1C family serine protease [Bythopirellula polymerisocia]|uniref:Periplasmic pH-dependent serine endoprotease DegQ n=1 Tax=Bythopirellula polymerisocia TaxID=2528003 RepID=A0A5C6CKS0_9BACT|nr:trypsin-like peptidase domain-containing protein [Bythopirellula polymerisocia]TWU24655.1 Periplasmic pH-dependent serine endoprotease DegQ precursor [Bythopirellula polymerisocia]
MLLCAKHFCTALLAGIVLMCWVAVTPAISQQLQELSAPGSREQAFAELDRDVDSLDAQLGIYKRVVRLVSPSVVHVEATPRPQYRLRRDAEEAGSAVLVRYRGADYVLTNRHVIKHSDASLISLELSDGRQLRPKKIWEDRETDVAVMLIEAENLVPARIGNSEQMEIGEIVLAFGSPFNLQRSVTRGIISAKGRSNLDLGEGEVMYQNFLQTDAAINPGNSGGPLVNLRGEVIGMNTAIASNSGGNEGIGFSIPINIAVRIMRQLIDAGEVERGFLGVALDRSFDDATARRVGLTRLTGARVTSITNASPASEADIQTDDIILRFDGMLIDNDEHLINLVKRTEVGRKVPMELFRSGQMLTVYVNIVKWKTPEPTVR